jgi:hypothetical protein
MLRVRFIEGSVTQQCRAFRHRQAKVGRNRHSLSRWEVQQRQRISRFASFTHGFTERTRGRALAQTGEMPAALVVYILRSLTAPNRPYIGLTRDLHKRLDAHNAGRLLTPARSALAGRGCHRIS